MARAIRRVWLVRIGWFILAMSVSACATTGDPRQGGLFGWSEKKAQERQTGLERDNSDAQSQLSAEQQQQRTLHGQEVSLQAESAHLRGEIDRLMAENTQLEGELRRLVNDKQLGEAELTRLDGVLAENDRLRLTLRSGSTAPPLQTQPDVVNDQNNKLHEEIMLLLRR